MADTRTRSPFAQRITSRRGSWITIGAAAVVYLVLFALFSSAEAPSQNDSVPPSSESAHVTELLDTFPNADEQTVILVASRDDGGELTDGDVDALESLRPNLDDQTGLEASAPRVSDDHHAAVITTSMRVGDDNAQTADRVASLRDVVHDHAPAGLTLQVTGGPAFGADVTSAFDGADFTLLAVTILIVAILLIVTYRSPILWLIPLIVVALADQLANKVTAGIGDALNLQFDAGVVSVLVFGAGTNYALLLISRYREELAAHDDHRAAMAVAWRRTAPAIVASNLTVVLALLTLTLAVIPGTHGLGISSAIGLILAIAAVLFALPPFLVACGRRVFWPFVPRPGSAARQGRVWHGIATRVTARPWASLGAGVVLLAVMASGLLGTSVGLTQLEQFRGTPESAVGLEVLGEHFSPGQAAPILVVTRADQADDVADAVGELSGVSGAHVLDTTADGDLAKLRVTGEAAPGTDASVDLVERIRTTVHDIPDADAQVGGQVAAEIDAQAGNERDLLVIAPIILIISFVVLVVLLRALVAPVVLLAANMASALAAIGAGAFLSQFVLGQSALALQVPLLAFMFLVALGIDYTIFLVHRAQTEAEAHGTKQGIVRAVTHTGSVITSAGIVLAGVFAALGVLPLVVLGQLGLIVGLGVLVDTIVVRTVIVPALFTLLGDRIWWPRRLHSARSADSAPDQQREATHEDFADASRR